MNYFRILVLGGTLALGACQSGVMVPPTDSDFFPPRCAVFFDSNSADLTDQAKSTLARTADDIRAFDARRSVPVSQYLVIGHSDSAGSAADNLVLGQRRAEAVRNELINLGIKPDILKASSKGKSEPLVLTKDGTPEPQNRRVEVHAN